jgi:hypothetical protein
VADAAAESAVQSPLALRVEKLTLAKGQSLPTMRKPAQCLKWFVDVLTSIAMSSMWLSSVCI